MTGPATSGPVAQYRLRADWEEHHAEASYWDAVVGEVKPLVVDGALDIVGDEIGLDLLDRALAERDCRLRFDNLIDLGSSLRVTYRPWRRRGESAAPAAPTFVPGDVFVLDAPTDVPAVWGEEGAEVIWSPGEPLMVCAPTGAGKTTLGQQLALARAGIRDPDVLGYAVRADPDRRVAYLAMDRPSQAARSMARMVGEEHREALAARMLFWRGPLAFQPTDEPARLARTLAERNVGTVVIDSLKDMAIGLAEDAVGAAVNQVIQHLTAAGIEALVLHHPRKASADNKTPNKLDDVYGSTFITAGMGSIVMLWGKAGDPVVEFLHLKQPAEEVGPFKVIHDHTTGHSTRAEHLTAEEVVRRGGPEGVTAREVAVAMYSTASPSEAEKKKAQRKLDGLAASGVLSVERGDKKAPNRYWSASTPSSAPSTPGRDLDAPGRTRKKTLDEDRTAHDTASKPPRPPFKGARPAHRPAARMPGQLDLVEELALLNGPPTASAILGDEDDAR